MKVAFGRQKLMSERRNYSPIKLSLPRGMRPYLHDIAQEQRLGATASEVCLFFIRNGLMEHHLRQQPEPSANEDD